MAVVDAASLGVGEIPAPSLLLALTEAGRAITELVTLQGASPLLRFAPTGDGHPVMVLPGFLAGGTTTAPLRRFLTSKGYETFCWGLGRNLGPHAIGPEGELLGQRLESIHRKMKRKVSLVGWSLGGIMARELAKRYPKYVRQVITLGSPFGGHPRANHVWRIYQAVTGQELDPVTMQDVFDNLAEPPKGIPSTAIFSKEDGVVSWRACVEKTTGLTDNIQVYASHCGLGVNPSVFFAVADRLALPDREWRPFDRDSSMWRRMVYPSSGEFVRRARA
ncbi:MAG: alpha/beta fold hydrolase [Alphaproteobacteria bacterium]|nr:alpha/beta fold hydrolase [Alphaproteobacteria bacterium]